MLAVVSKRKLIYMEHGSKEAEEKWKMIPSYLAWVAKGYICAIIEKRQGVD